MKFTPRRLANDSLGLLGEKWAISFLPMNLENAVTRIRECFDQMNKAYQRKVFDEVAIVEIASSSVKVHYYDGPRQAVFMEEFPNKTVAVRKELLTEQSEHGGEFGFTREGAGDHFDAYICVGPQVYLFCNNLEKSMHEITEDPRWLEAQAKFLNASQVFAADPLTAQG